MLALERPARSGRFGGLSVTATGSLLSLPGERWSHACLRLSTGHCLGAYGPLMPDGPLNTGRPVALCPFLGGALAAVDPTGMGLSCALTSMLLVGEVTRTLLLFLKLLACVSAGWALGPLSMATLCPGTHVWSPFPELAELEVYLHETGSPALSGAGSAKSATGEVRTGTGECP